MTATCESCAHFWEPSLCLEPSRNHAQTSAELSCELHEQDGAGKVIAVGTSTGPTPFLSGEQLRASVASLEGQVCGTWDRATWLDSEWKAAWVFFMRLAGYGTAPPLGPVDDFATWTDPQLRNWERWLQKRLRRIETQAAKAAVRKHKEAR